MKIAVEGCCHGELDKIYETLEYIEKLHNYKIDLLLICGDFQAVRNKSDLHCMAVPPKFQKMNTFYKYYSGEKKAPVLTLFIGGNHEASNYMQELPYGGWVAPNIYYMGYAGIVNIGGLHIGEQLWQSHFYYLFPLQVILSILHTLETKHTAYHVRSIDVFRLKQVTRSVDIMMSHDWPRGIYNYGDVQVLLKYKKYFKEEVENNTLGSPPAMELLLKLKPQYWFSAHLHVKFAAVLQHDVSSDAKTTNFLSLDKCLPRRHFLQVIDVPHDASKPMKLMLDPEWLVILKSTNHLLNLTKIPQYLPGPGCKQRYDFTVSDKEIDAIYEDFGGDLSLPENFEMTVPVYDPLNSTKKAAAPPQTNINKQTTLLCTMLDITEPNSVFLRKDSSYKIQVSFGEPFEVKQDEDIDGGIDEDYESEMSFVSFSDVSSHVNESVISAGNQDESSLGDAIDVDDDMVCEMASGGEMIDAEDDELQAILSAQKDLKMNLAGAKSSDMDLKSSGDIEMLHKGFLNNAHKKLNFLKNLSSSSLLSLSNTSMEMKFLDIGLKEDEDELQEILKVQREEKLKESQTDKTQSDSRSVSMFGDRGQDFNNISGLEDHSVMHQSSPAVSTEEHTDISKKLGVASRLEASFEKLGLIGEIILLIQHRTGSQKTEKKEPKLVYRSG
ncbi:hypothetical protein ACJMK2_041890 [Sinanodonta woodiana]|uniref:Lariat debranching enzyme C-terminal domain-containing protein n=1 Tax=Sinanodonta woodiana TaxID=1069815 RepID=A0ABD3W5M5_SINWO